MQKIECNSPCYADNQKNCDRVGSDVQKMSCHLINVNMWRTGLSSIQTRLDIVQKKRSKFPSQMESHPSTDQVLSYKDSSVSFYSGTTMVVLSYGYIYTLN